MRSAFPLALSAVALLVTACSAGAADDAARTVRVTMSDDMSYQPDAFAFDAGDSVTFEVTNVGAVRHEFFIGDVAEHDEHAAEMREGAGAHSDDAHANPASISVDPGESETLTYAFEEAGQLEVGCHEPGHYEAGMRAPITVHP